MGNSTSCVDNSTYARQTNDDSDVDSKDSDALEQAAKVEMERRIQVIKHLEQSLKKDQSQANLLTQFANILGLEDCNIELIANVISKINSDWKTIDDSFKGIETYLGIEEVNKLKSLRLEYFSLLMKTRSVIDGLCESCEIQSDNIKNLRKLVTKYKEQERNGSDIEGVCLDTYDSKYYESHLNILKKWIDQTELTQLVTKWEQITKRLDERRGVIQKAYNKFKSQKKWTKVLIGTCAVLGSLAIIGTIIALSVATSGAAAAIAAGTAKYVTVFGIKMVTSHLIAAGIGIGAAGVLTGAGIAYGMYHVKEKEEQIEKINKIKEMIQEMINKGLFMNDKLSNLNDINDKIGKRIKLVDIANIDAALIKIEQYLDNYQNQGKKILDAIEAEKETYFK